MGLSPEGRLARAWPTLLVIAAGCVVLCPYLGSIGFWDPWEPKYAESVREMRELGSYWVPYYRDEVRLTKPILVYWGILAGSSVLGLNELGARIGGIAAGIATLFVVYHVVARLRGRRAGLLSALVLGSSPLFYFVMRQATPDAYLLTSSGSALALFALARFGPDERRRTLDYGLSFACFALAVLAKGPIVAGTLYFGPLVLWALVRRESFAGALPAFARRTALFCGVVLLVAGPWHVAVWLSGDESYVSEFLVKHNVARIGTEINSAGVSDFYLRTLLFGLFPWSCLLPLTGAAIRAPAGEAPSGSRDLALYAALAAAVTFVAFSIPVTKFHHYLAPITVPAAVLVGILLDRWLEEPERMSVKAGAVLGLLFYLPPMIDLLREDNVKYLIGVFTVKRFVPESSAPGPAFTALLLAGAAALGWLALRRTRWAVGAFVACALAFSLYNTAVLIPGLDRHKTMKHLCESWRAERKGDEPIAFHGSMKHGIFFYTSGEVEVLGRTSEVVDFLTESRPAYLIVERARLPELEADDAWRERGIELRVVDPSHFDYVLVANDGEGSAALPADDAAGEEGDAGADPFD